MAAEGKGDEFRVVSSVLRSICFTEWLDYHFALGVSHFYLYFDADDDPNIEVARRYGPDRVSIRQGQAPGRPITVKQCANVRHALLKARGMSGWMLHIDDDELLHLAPGVTLRDIARAAPPETYDLHFRNYEVCKTVPELNGYDFFSREQFFYTKVRRSYRNGKSAVGLHWADKGVAPNGAHYFHVPGASKVAAGGGVEEEEDEKEGKEAEADGGEGFFMEPKAKDAPGMLRVRRELACVLHYPFIVYPRWRSKCSREDLSEWKVNWGFYRSSKKLIGEWADGEEELQREFLRRCVVAGEKLERLESQGEVIRISSAAELIVRGQQLRSSS